MTVTLSYTIIQIHDLIHRSNPIVNKNNIKDFYSDVFALDLNKENQIFAFSVIGTDGKTKYDPKYVRIMAVYDM